MDSPTSPPRRNNSRRVAALRAGLALLLTLGLGCGRRAAVDSPAGVVERFDELMRQGKYDEAAGYFAYDTRGARDSTDWSTYSESQRKLIVSKLHAGKTAALEAGAARWTGKNYQVGAVTRTGDTATVQLKPATGPPVQVQLVHEDGGWRILQLPGF